jgi:hypothetical protein
MPRQEGVVLLVMLALLFVATLLGIAMVVSTTGETRMASLRSQREFSHTLAEAGASAVALKALNDLDPNQALQNQTWDCKTLDWQGGMGSTTSQTQPGGACTIALEAQGGSYSGWLKISAGTSDTMANQLRAQAAVVPLLSGIGSIIGAPGRAGFVVAAATLSPDPGAAAIPGAAWLQRNGGWYWPVASATGNQSTPQSPNGGATTTQPFALKAIPPTPSQLPDQPWTTYNWTDYKRGLDSDAVTTLRNVAITVGVSQRYQALSDAYGAWQQAQDDYIKAREAAMTAAQAADLANTAIQAAGAVAGAASGGTASAASGAIEIQVDTQPMTDAGNEYIDAAAAVIQARQAIREPWDSLDALHEAEGGAQAVWSCGSDGNARVYTEERDMTDVEFQQQTAATMPVDSSGGQGGGQGGAQGGGQGGAQGGGQGGAQGGGQQSNVQRVEQAASDLQTAAQGDDPIGALITTGASVGDTSNEKEPGFMLINAAQEGGKADGLAQTNPMCNADAELIIQAQSGTSSGSGTSPSSAPAAPCQPGASENSQNASDQACANNGSNATDNPPGEQGGNSGNESAPASPTTSSGSSEPALVQQATIVHTGAITFKAEAPLQNSKVADILVSKGKITVASDQQDQSGQAGLVLWTDGDIAINRPVSGAAVAGGTVTVDPTDQTMLTYNPAVDPLLLGNGKFPLAGYTLGSWTSLASAP